MDGKEEFFDPGSRYCPYGHLAWKHTSASGLRQTDDGTSLVQTPAEIYTSSRIQRVANLTMDQQGIATGTVNMTYMGASALRWRQRSLTGDTTSLEHDLRTSVEELLPAGMDVKVTSIEKLADYEQPLRVNLTVRGEIGSSTGKRLIIPADIFEANAKPSFPHEKRDIPVYFDYPYMHQDAVRVHFPASLTVESMPASTLARFQNMAAYSMSTESTPTSVTTRRDYSLGTILFLTKEYPELRSFYSKMDAADQGSIVLNASPVAAAKSVAAAN